MFWHWDLPMTGLDWNLFHDRALEFHGKISFMKAGLVFADMLSTVSPTYAREIQTPAGRGLDGLLRDRRDDLRGIVNGIDHRLEPEPRADDRGTIRRFDRREGKAPARPGCRGTPDSPSGRTSPFSPRSAGSIRRKAGSCSPRSRTAAGPRRSANCAGHGLPEVP